MRKKIPMSFAADLWDRTRITRLDSILASDPDDIDANYEKRTTLLELCRSNEALECFGNVLRQEPAHMESWVGRGRALTMEEDYDGAKACFGKVPENDEVGKDAMHWSDINEWYRARRGQRQTSTVETVAEKNFNDSLENWMKQHLSHIQNLRALLIRFMSDKYCHRRKPGNAFHAYLVKKFYEDSGPLKVVAVECNDIEPNTDVDIRLDGNICLVGAIKIRHPGIKIRQLSCIAKEVRCRGDLFRVKTRRRQLKDCKPASSYGADIRKKHPDSLPQAVSQAAK